MKEVGSEVATKESYKAPKWAKNPNIQTILPRLLKPKLLHPYDWEKLDTPDQDFIELAWSKKPESPKGLAVIFHGLEGSAESHYAISMVNHLSAHGWQCVVVHFRGCGRHMNDAPRFYHSGDTSDAKRVLDKLKQQNPDVPIFAIGYSLGANMLLKLLGEESNQSWVDGAIAISPPFDLAMCSQQITQGFSRVYEKALVNSMHNRFLEKAKTHDYEALLAISQEDLKKLDTFYKFDDRITGPLHGFSDANDYYARCSSIRFMGKIMTPTLVLHAKDDPFMHPDIVPKKNQVSDSVTLEISDTGGHVGFIQGKPWRPTYWLPRRVLHHINLSIGE